MTKFKAITTYEQLDNGVFDKDIKELYKMLQPAKILGKNVRYSRPGLAQSGMFLNFIIESFSPVLFSPDELRAMNQDKVFEEVIKFIKEKTDSEDEESDRIIGAAFSSKAALEYLYPLIRQCFPDLNPFQITNEALLECFNKVFTDFFESTT